jgi:RNA polymerase sigma-70 factor (ECF subfamily)
MDVGMKTRASSRICALYGGYRGQVLRRARQLLGQEEEAEDATQEVFLRLIDADERLLLHPEPMAWLLRVTTNLCLNRLRDQKRRKNLLAQKPAANDQHGQDAEMRTAVIEILAGIPDDLQQIAVHYHADGMTCDEIAPLFGVSRRTIGNRLLAFQRLANEKLGGDAAVPAQS